MISQSIAETMKKRNVRSTISHTDYIQSKTGFQNFLRDLADDLFPFSSFHQYQDEILYEILDAYLIEGYSNVVVEGPTGIGKSAINVTVPHVLAEVAENQTSIRQYFGVNFDHLKGGSAFYTTPQKSLRDQLANDEDLKNYVSMLKSRRDYICGETGEPSNECSIKYSSDQSCVTCGGCTYWKNKNHSMDHLIAAITFAMQVVDNYVAEETQDGTQLSYKNREMVIVDEGHSSEQQSASLFAGFTLSPWSFPDDVYGDIGERVDWDAEKMEDVLPLLEELNSNAEDYISRNKEKEDKMTQKKVDECKKMTQKLRYAFKTQKEGDGWAVNISKVANKQKGGKTKSIEMKPIRVGDFLSEFIWSRGQKRLITSATIPFRNNVNKWGERIGLESNIKFISKRTPFPEEHRKIHLNTITGPMDSQNEDDNWCDAMQQIQEISSNHENEKGLIHCVSYSRAERVAESLGEDNVMIEPRELEQSVVIERWYESDKDILVSPSMTEGVDLHGDRCRWQVLLKVPFAYIGDNRISYLLNEENEWGWYMENAAIDIIQSIGRAVRGPEPEEAASYYVLDEKFVDVMKRTSPPEYIIDAIRESPPEHWDEPEQAPWRC